MKKVVLVLALAILLSFVTYTIDAQTGREVAIIEVSEGTVVEIKEVVAAEHPAGNVPPASEANVVVEIERIEVPEGVIIVETEILNPQPQSNSANTDENPLTNDPERWQEINNTLARLQQELEEVRAAQGVEP
jgi:hypothetical protein